jgi:fumarylacetoacetase
MSLNETHDATLTSWVASANAPGCDFTIQNLPYGAFRRRGANESFRIGVAIGDQVLDMQAAFRAGVFEGAARDAAALLQGATLNPFMGAGATAWSALRLALSRALRAGSADQARLGGALTAQSDAEMTVPASIGDYSDFFTSIHHATSVGKLFRPDNPLMPNYKFVPIAYHGRSSSIGVSGQSFPRPVGQTMPPGASVPSFGPSKRLDYELELAVWVGTGNAQGTRVTLEESEAHAFGMCLLNDWSARDIQAWEYQPLGPFLAKNFASTISPWVVTMEALEPFRTAWTRPAADPQPLPYLESAGNRARGAIDIGVEAWLQTARMRQAGVAPQRLSRSSFRHAYWTVAQMITHHTVGGCNLQPGDLLGTGTQSGPTPEEAGSLLELTVGGKQTIALPGGETRTFLEDHDTLTLKAACEAAGHARVGFGTCSGTVLPTA